MSALTYEVADLNSPVCVWLRSRFPDHKEIQAGYRAAAGTARVLPSPEVALQTQGAAIDWWIRFLADPAPTLGLALSGLAEIQGLPCFRAGMRLLAGLRELLSSYPMTPGGRQAGREHGQNIVGHGLGLSREELERQLPRWHMWKGIAGLWYASRRNCSPPVVVRGEDLRGLREEIRRWLGTH